MKELFRMLLLLSLGSASLLALTTRSYSSKGLSSSQKPILTYQGAVADLFRENCMACHNHTARKGGLVLETFESIMAGGRRGAVIVSGRPDQSRLLKMIDGSLEPQMPPGQPLDQKEITLVKDWISGGARRGPDLTAAPIVLDRAPVSPLPSLKPTAPVRPAASSLAFRPDGAMLAVGRYRGVDLLNPKDGSLLRHLSGHSGQVRALAFSANGKQLVSAGGNPGEFGEFKVWDVASSKELLNVRGHSDSIFGIALSPDGLKLATASYDKLVKVWDAKTGAQLLSLKEHTDAVFSVAFGSDGTRIASASADRTVKIWNAVSGDRILTIADAADGLLGLAFHPDGKFLAASGSDRVIRIWELSDDEARSVRSMIGHEEAVHVILFSPDGKMLASAGGDRAIKLWDASKLTEIATIEVQPDWVFALAFSPDGKRLFAGRSDGSLAAYDTVTGKRSSMK